MAVTLAELIILGILVDWVFRKFRFPGLIGMLFLGVLAGPSVLNMISPQMHEVSGDLRLIALIVILLRAGFQLSKDALIRVGRMAVLLSFIPASFEIAAITVLGHFFLDLTYLESAMLGTVVGAVSPAVVVPLMIRFIMEKKGTGKGIPTMMIAGGSMDNVFAIVVFSVFLGFYTGSMGNVAWKVAGIPISIMLGVIAGTIMGFALVKIFERFNPRATKRVLVIIGISILLFRFQRLLENIVPFASLVAIMAIGFIILEKKEHMAHEISAKLGKIWVFAEIVLFTLVGAQVDLGVTLEAGLPGSAVIILALFARSAGTWLCFIGSPLTLKERLFGVIAYLPKASVQAAIGGTALIVMRQLGMPTRPGEIILAVGVLSIVLTAPAGAFAISFFGEKWLDINIKDDHAAEDAVRESEGEYDLMEDSK